ncbi:winged helix-turn-helix transcriptional regulator [Pseudooceanicola sp. C21-150M6]|uniref:winged helix-turn-helix transcriptional regulator n=1 Tax=Pseudooceanicola sp. C21-150M6 TaxID=3434355 RepID=UPI003D7F2398
MDIELLVKITARAWSLNILDRLDAGVPGRQAPLLAATGASRTAFGQSLSHLIDLGLLERNPGHGHPLRPEFRLTPEGVQAALMAGRVMQAGQEAPALLRRTWSLPILTVCQRPMYFGEIRGALPAISDRALSQGLKQLHGQDWLRRETETTCYPPRPVYLALGTGMEVAAATGLVA